MIHPLFQRDILDKISDYLHNQVLDNIILYMAKNYNNNVVVLQLYNLYKSIGYNYNKSSLPFFPDD